MNCGLPYTQVVFHFITHREIHVNYNDQTLYKCLNIFREYQVYKDL